MSVPPSSPHAFALCQPGYEKWLKSEVQSSRPDLHPGFQRPGLVTFRATGAPFSPDSRLQTVFGRAWGCSAGPVADPQALLDLAERVGAVHLFVGPRDQGPADEVPPERQAEADAQAGQVEEALRPRFPVRALREGDTVLDVVTSPGEPTLAGWHIHGPGRHQGPCGRFTYPDLEEAPARSWRKVAEGLLWAGVRIQPGDRVLDVGAAPGGGTLVFVRAGAQVYAVDSQPMAPGVLAHPAVHWRRCAVGDLRREEIPEGIRWLAMDANIPPDHALRAVQRLMPALRRSLRGMLLTLKLNDEARPEGIPSLLDQVRDLCGPRRPGSRDGGGIRATHLPSNRREFFVFARLRSDG